jgi:hypothetical protein
MYPDTSKKDISPAIKPGTTGEGPLPVLGHTPDIEGKYGSYVTPEMIENKKTRQLQEDIKWLNIKKNN